MLLRKIFDLRCSEMLFPSFWGHIFSFSPNRFVYSFVVSSEALNTGKLKLSLREYYSAMFNEILTRNNNALLSELMAFILFTN